MSTTKWHWITWSNAKCHLVPASLRNSLLADAKARNFGELQREKLVTKAALELAGCMVHAHRPWEQFRLSGIQLSFPSEEIARLADLLEQLELRRFSAAAAQPYYKLHGTFAAWVLKPAHWTELHRNVKTRIGCAEERARAFYADKKPMGQILADANNRGRQVAGLDPLSYPIEPHPTDRFIPKERGQA